MFRPRSRALRKYYWSVIVLLWAWLVFLHDDGPAHLLLVTWPALRQTWVASSLMLLNPRFLPGPEWIRLARLYRENENETLSFELKRYKLTDTPPYHALSYTWGPAWAEEGSNTTQSQKWSPYNFGPRQKDVPVNMVRAIHMLCPLDLSTYYWIDAVCINQHSNRERSHQVGNMHNIFKYAEAVDVWLGWGHEIVDKLHATMRDTAVNLTLNGNDSFSGRHRERPHRRSPKMLDGKKLLGDDGWIALVHLFSRRWFHRLWTLQEFALATKVNIWCGTTLLDWRILQATAEYLSDENVLMGLKYGRSGIGGTAIKHLSALQTAVRCPNSIDFSFLSCLNPGVPNEVPDYESILAWIYWRSITTFATDPRDYVYGIVGVANSIAESLGLDYEPYIADYSLSDSAVFQAFTARLMKGRLGSTLR